MLPHYEARFLRTLQSCVTGRRWLYLATRDMRQTVKLIAVKRNLVLMLVYHVKRVVSVSRRAI